VVEIWVGEERFGTPTGHVGKKRDVGCEEQLEVGVNKNKREKR